jgi:hypothetical protein
MPMDQRAARAKLVRTPLQTISLWFALCFAAPGVIFILIGGTTAVHTARFINAAEPGVAQVVSTRFVREVKRRWSYETVFDILTADGRHLTVTRRSKQSYTPNLSVAVLYRTEPTVEIFPFETEWLWSASLLQLRIASVFLGLAGLTYLLRRWFCRSRTPS